LERLAEDPLLRALATAWVVLAGAAIGSFLNVVIARVPHGLSVVSPRSRCPACGAPIGWRDNVPVLSWILLAGRCRACRARISLRYPLVEIAIAVAAWLAVRRHGFSPAALAEVALAALVLALALIDVDTWLLPFVLSIPLGVLGLVASALQASPAPSLRASAVGAAVGFGALAIVSAVGRRLAGREALGFGDVVLLGALGAWFGAGALLPIVLLASLQGSVVGLALLAAGKLPGSRRPPEVPASPQAPPDPAPSAAPAAPAAPAEDDWVPPRNGIPFGPFLALAALEWLYLRAEILRVVPAIDPFL
jgi:leader peptidase (prepilin peptidase)/N-methyltransferase